jgi:hypothetical protein
VTFNSRPAFAYRVDYAELPPHFETYSAADQERIRVVMARVAGQQASVDSEQASI